MTTSSSRLSLGELLDFDVLETAKTLESQLREVESLCQEVKTRRDQNRMKRKRLDKELASLNAQLHQQVALTQKVASKMKVSTVGGSWIPDKTLFSILDGQDEFFPPTPAFREHSRRSSSTSSLRSRLTAPKSPSTHSRKSPEDPWDIQFCSEPATQPASAFIEYPEPYNDNYVLSGSCTSPLAFETSGFILSPPAVFSDFSDSSFSPPSPPSDVFPSDVSSVSFVQQHGSAPGIGHGTRPVRKTLASIQEDGEADDDLSMRVDVKLGKKVTTEGPLAI